eukprot:12043010-Alexandrium_andersonii.AAC.1
MSASLVGSEMCIRDRDPPGWCRRRERPLRGGYHPRPPRLALPARRRRQLGGCLLYTSDAADDM